MELDRYARDVALWQQWAAINYRAANTLFNMEDLSFWFPAATLGHHALEMYLKAALIANGMTVFDPNKVNRLDAGVNLVAADCAWGHVLVQLAETLALRNPGFDLSRPMNFEGFLGNVAPREPMTIREGLGHL